MHKLHQMRKLLLWIGKPHEALAVLDEGTRLAEQMKDTLWIKELQVRAGRIYCFVLKDIQGYRSGCKPEGTYVIATKQKKRLKPAFTSFTAH